MNKQTDMALSVIDRFVNQLGPINLLIDFVLDKIIPKTTAKACHSGNKCYSSCSGLCANYIQNGVRVCKYNETVVYTNNSYCDATCSNGCVCWRTFPIGSSCPPFA